MTKFVSVLRFSRSLYDKINNTVWIKKNQLLKIGFGSGSFVFFYVELKLLVHIYFKSPVENSVQNIIK